MALVKSPCCLLVDIYKAIPGLSKIVCWPLVNISTTIPGPTVAEAQKQHLWPALTSDIWTLKLKSCYETRSRYAWFSIFRDVAVLGANSELTFYEYQQ